MVSKNREVNMDSNFWHLAELILKYALAPLVWLWWWDRGRLVARMDSQDLEMKETKGRVSTLEVDNAVIASKIDDIKEDTRDIKRIVENLTNDRK